MSIKERYTVIFMERKTVSISSKRQITIPQKYYSMLGFGDEAECILRDNEIILRPVRQNSGGEFAEQILADLIAQGYSGDQLLSQFKKRQSQVRPAVEAMISQADDVAHGNGEYSTYADIFADTGENDG